MIFTYVCHTGEPLPLTTRGALQLLAEGRAHIERDGVPLPALESLAKVGATCQKPHG